MKVIFLDVDGVLNSYERGGPRAISKGKLKKLRDIVWCSDAKIVVTSSWRLEPKAYAKLKRYLSYKGMYIFDRTIDMQDAAPRGDEITFWLDEFQELGIDGYVILDDMHESQFEDHVYNLVQTDSNEGLTDKDVLIALDILNHGDEV